MPTFYHRDQTGAPTYAYSTSASNVAHFNAFKTILKACLVYGYGDQPGAGWELIAEGDRYIVLRNGTHSCYVCFSWPANAPSMNLWLAETFSGVASDVMQGAGLKSGTAAGSGVGHAVTIAQLAYSSAVSSWYMVADEATFVFQFCGNPAFTTTRQNHVTLFVGEDSAGWPIAMGGADSTAGSYSRFDAMGFTSLYAPETGLLVDSGSLSVLVPGLTDSSASIDAVCAMPEASFCKAWWGVSGGLLVGTLRGIAVEPLLMRRTPDACAFALAGVTRTSRTVNQPLDIGDGEIWLLAPHYQDSAACFVTAAPEFW